MGNLTAILGADTSGFKKSIQEAQSVLEKYTQTAKKAGNQIDKNVSVTSEQVTAYNRVVNVLEKVNSGSMSTTQAQKALTAQIRELKIQWSELSDEIKNSDFGKAMSNSMSAAESKLKTLNAQLSQTKEKVTESSDSAEKMNTSSKSLGATVGKLSAALVAIKAASGIFKSAIDSSQSSSDSFDRTIYTATATVEGFFHTLMTGDFTFFSEGIEGIISKCRQAAQAIDQLQNSTMSFGVINAKAQVKLTKARAVLYDPDATKEEIKQAKQDMQDAFDELKASASTVINDYQNQILAEVQAKAGLNLSEEDMGIIEKWVQIDASAGREAAKESAEAAYKAYREEYDKLDKEYTSYRVITGTGVGTGFGAQPTYMPVNKEGKTEALNELKEQYKEAIVYHTIINKLSDKQLSELGQSIIAMSNLENQSAQYEANMEKIGGRLDNANKKIEKTAKEVKELNKPVAPDGSIAKIEELLSEKKKSLSMAIDDESRMKIQQEIEELTGQKNAIELRLTPVVDLSGMNEAIAAYAGNAPDPKNRMKGHGSNVMGAYNKSNAASSIKEELDFNQKLLDTYQKQYQSIQKRLTVGAALTKEEAEFTSIYEETKKKVDELSKAYIVAANNAEHFKASSELNDKSYEGIKQLSKGTIQLIDSYRELGEKWNEMSDWDTFTSIIDSIFETIDAFRTLSDTINTVKEVMLVLSSTEQAMQAIEDANTAKTLANETAKASAAGTTAATQAVAAGVAATAGGAQAGWPAMLIAIPIALAMVASALASAKSFTTGGIIKGATSVGDYNIARLNNGEMILNGTQQKRLFTMLNGSGNVSGNSSINGGVEFKIRGQELVGILKNYNSKMSKV